MFTLERVAEIEAMCERATSDWKAEPMTSKKVRSANARNGTDYYKVTDNHENIAHYLTRADAQFIAQARTLLPALAAEWKAQREVVEAARNICDDCPCREGCDPDDCMNGNLKRSLAKLERGQSDE